MTNTVMVSVQLPTGEEITAGELEQIKSGSGSVPSARFTYVNNYLRAAGSYNLSPELHFSLGSQETAVHRQLFSAFEDAAPDSWGKELIQEEARLEGLSRGVRTPRLSAFESLIRVPDNTRQGALRFSNSGVALGRDANPAAANLVDWGKLVRAADNLEAHRPDDEGLRVLFRYGTSAGGARPKTNVITASGKLAIAKLPHRDDRWDVSRWEATTLIMAAQAGITVPRHKLHGFGENRSILMLERFDRTIDGLRIGYLSARSLLNIEDQDSYRGSYTHFAEQLRRHAGRADLHELFRRICLSLLVTNADDHMRNHGLLREKSGWRLSPSFDVNPARNPSFDSTPITRTSDPTDRDLRELLDVCETFDLTTESAKRIIVAVERATRDWAEIGIRLGEPAESIPFFAPMFEHPNRVWAQRLSVSISDESEGFVRRGDRGLGPSSGGGNSGSFARREAAESSGEVHQ